MNTIIATILAVAIFIINGIYEPGVYAGEFKNKFDLSTRYDNRTDRPSREQYRVRLYSGYHFDNTWSVHGFAITGDEFSSSYNTFGEENDFNIRRLYVRHQEGPYKSEFGVIPTYKGRVSSTGLSKDGWIAGGRFVNYFDTIGTVELVVGEISNIESPDAIGFIRKVNYVELELTSEINQSWDYELGLDRILDGNFARAEVRYKPDNKSNIALEIINRLDNSSSSAILSHSNTIHILGYPLELFVFYSYVSNEFGPRAELTEDFINTGNAIQLELEGKIIDNLEWFLKAGSYEEQDRFQLGVTFKF
jgi:hypothetical protein